MSTGGVEQSLSLHEQILNIESMTWDALKQSGSALLPFMTKDCTMILPYATIIDHNSEPSLKDILTRDDLKPWDRYKLDNVKVIPLGEKAASICYEVEAARGKEIYEAMVCSIWRREADNWKMCMHQQTPMTMPAAPKPRH